jgi:hypothetical protein
MLTHYICNDYKHINSVLQVIFSIPLFWTSVNVWDTEHTQININVTIRLIVFCRISAFVALATSSERVKGSKHRISVPVCRETRMTNIWDNTMFFLMIYPKKHSLINRGACATLSFKGLATLI